MCFFFMDDRQTTASYVFSLPGVPQAVTDTAVLEPATYLSLPGVPQAVAMTPLSSILERPKSLIIILLSASGLNKIS